MKAFLFFEGCWTVGVFYMEKISREKEGRMVGDRRKKKVKYRESATYDRRTQRWRQAVRLTEANWRRKGEALQEKEMTAKQTRREARRRKVRQAGANRRRWQADRGRSWEKQRGVTRQQEDKKGEKD